MFICLCFILQLCHIKRSKVRNVTGLQRKSFFVIYIFIKSSNRIIHFSINCTFIKYVHIFRKSYFVIKFRLTVCLNVFPGILIEGLDCILAVAVGAGFGVTSCSQNIGAISLTKVNTNY